jgi:hypothetical protein
MKMLAHRWRWREIYPYLEKIGQIARNAEIKPLETTDRQGHPVDESRPRRAVADHQLHPLCDRHL